MSETLHMIVDAAAACQASGCQWAQLAAMTDARDEAKRETERAYALFPPLLAQIDAALNGPLPADALRGYNTLPAQVARITQEVSACYAALRGEQGITLPDGYHVNVAELRDELAQAREAQALAAAEVEMLKACLAGPEPALAAERDELRALADDRAEQMTKLAGLVMLREHQRDAAQATVEELGEHLAKLQREIVTVANGDRLPEDADNNLHIIADAWARSRDKALRVIAKDVTTDVLLGEIRAQLAAAGTINDALMEQAIGYLQTEREAHLAASGLLRRVLDVLDGPASRAVRDDIHTFLGDDHDDQLVGA